jgi:hypothetical protein
MTLTLRCDGAIIWACPLATPRRNARSLDPGRDRVDAGLQRAAAGCADAGASERLDPTSPVQ